MTTWKEDGYYGTPQGTAPPPPGFLPGGYPQPGYPQPGYPQPGYPQPGFPQGGYPPGGYPSAGYPQGGYPSAGYPGSFGGSPPPTAGMQGYNSTSYAEDPIGAHAFDFSDKSIRLGFIRKVYGILMVQLTVTLSVIALFTFHEGTKQYVFAHPSLWVRACKRFFHYQAFTHLAVGFFRANTRIFLYWCIGSSGPIQENSCIGPEEAHSKMVESLVVKKPVTWSNPEEEMRWISLIAMFVCLLSMACCGEVRRRAPMNFIFLSIFTLAESFLLGCATATFKKEEVFLAVLICTIVTLGLTLFAFQTKIDFTMMGGVLFVAALILMIFGIITIFWHGKTITLIYASFGALLFSVYIIYDTQIMLGGKHKYAISPEEYIFAALNLYLDIVNLFLYILTIIGASRD